MEFKKSNIIGIILALVIIIIALFLFKTKGFFFLMGIGVLVGVAPFILSMINETKAASEKEEMFLEFTRNLAESVKTGTPISKSITNVKNKPYGLLTLHISKLANQISLGIPLKKALEVFARDVDNKAIARTVSLIGQAETAGGDIGEILESVAGAVNMSDKLKKERKATISTLVVQGYIIFFIFMLIILIIQFKILPMVSGIATSGITDIGGFTSVSGGEINPDEISSSFLYLLLIQGLFSGLVIGKLSEGNVKSGIKHSFVLMLMSFLISAGANLIFG
jgi:archaeal flagellar protein FlaJ